MFWLARLIRLLRPIPPTPTQAIFSKSLGGVYPRPRTCRGTIVTAALATAAFSIKLRREISFFSSDIRITSNRSGMTGSKIALQVAPHHVLKYASSERNARKHIFSGSSLRSAPDLRSWPPRSPDFLNKLPGAYSPVLCRSFRVLSSVPTKSLLLSVPGYGRSLSRERYAPGSNRRHQGLKRLTFAPAIDAAPAWSPDGPRLLLRLQSNPWVFTVREKRRWNRRR